MRPVRRVLHRMLLVLAAIAVVGALVVFNPLRWWTGDDDVEVVAARDRDEISVQSLQRTVEATGVLQPAGAATAVTAEGGTVTALAPIGALVSAGDVLFEIDGAPAMALSGEMPAWRTMTADDIGGDVAQLEAGLVALGYDPDGLLTVDDTYTAYTAEVVARWQADVGRTETGVVELGSVVFVPTGGRVSSTATAIGDEVGGATAAAVLTVSESERELVFTVAAADVDTVAVGTEVTARMPDRSTVTGEVTAVAAGADGSLTATAVPVDGTDLDALPDGESVPVTVSWTVFVATDVLTVGAAALTRLDQGGYALEVVTGSGATSFVPVEIGARSGSTVEVVTDLEPGTVIISP